MFFVFIKRILATTLLCLSVATVSAQIKEVNIGVNGLTCSQCTRSVEMRIRKLPFVKDVVMNLENTEGRVLFKDGEKVNIDKIAQAVEDAGFSVRYLTAVLVFNNNTSVTPGACVRYQGDTYKFVYTSTNNVNGATTLTFIGNKFQDKKELKKWTNYLKSNCNDVAGTVYYVSM